MFTLIRMPHPPFARSRRSPRLAMLALLRRSQPSRRRGDRRSLKSVAALPAHVAGQFEQLTACQQTAERRLFRLRSPRAFRLHRAAEPRAGAEAHRDRRRGRARAATRPRSISRGDDTFVVADAPGGRPRIQIFTTSGSTIGGFYLQGRAVPRVTLRQPGAERHRRDRVHRQVALRESARARRADRRVQRRRADRCARSARCARPATRPTPTSTWRSTPADRLANPRPAASTSSSLPACRSSASTTPSGRLVFERHIEGTELDEFIQGAAHHLEARRTGDGEIPLVLPSVYAAAADAAGQSVDLARRSDSRTSTTPAGEKRRTVQFRAAGRLRRPACRSRPAGGCWSRRAASRSTADSRGLRQARAPRPVDGTSPAKNARPCGRTRYSQRAASNTSPSVLILICRSSSMRSGARLHVEHARIVHVVAVGDLPRERHEFQRAHRLDQADVEQAVVDDGVRGDEPAAADQP